MAKNRHNPSNSLILLSLDDLVPNNHLVRDLNEFVDWNFIYDICDPLYSDVGTNRVDPVVLFKMMMINIIFGIHSMRKTCEEIEVNFAYRWFLNLSVVDKVPNHSTFSQNYRRKFKDNQVATKIFIHIIQMLNEHGVLDLTTVFADGTHLKANANKNKHTNKEVEDIAKLYQKELDDEIDEDRKRHNKKPLKRNKKKETKVKNIKVSKNDSDCGYFHKGEKEKCFAYNLNTSCDRHGYVLGVQVDPGNVHDCIAFFGLYAKLRCIYQESIQNFALDAGYITPAISKLLTDNNQLLFVPYKRPMTKKGFFKKHEYVYDEYYDCYICPNEKILEYSTTNKEGYKEYKSNPKECANCPMIDQCTKSKVMQKVVTRHIWEECREAFSDELRHSDMHKEIYPKRKETIERVFADGKRRHGLDYTLYTGKEAVEFNTLLIFGAMNLKKFSMYMRKLKDKYAQNLSYEHQGEEVISKLRLI